MADIAERLKAEAEKVSVMDAPLYYVHISCAEARDVVDTIETLRAENARLKEDLHEYVMQAESGNQKQVAEMCKLRTENARLRENLARRFEELQETTWTSKDVAYVIRNFTARAVMGETE